MSTDTIGDASQQEIRQEVKDLPEFEIQDQQYVEDPNRRAYLLDLIQSLNANHQRFLQGLIQGKSATQAYLAARPNSSFTAAATSSCRLLNSEKIKEALSAALELQGVRVDTIGKRLSLMLHGKLDNGEKEAWQTDKALTHLRHMFGLDAVKESILHVNRKSVTVNIDLKGMGTLLEESKKRLKKKST